MRTSASTATPSRSARGASWSGPARDLVLVAPSLARWRAARGRRADRGRGRRDHRRESRRGIAAARCEHPRGLDVAGPGERPLARLPASASWAHAAWFRLVLDVARADVPAGGEPRPGELSRARARDLRRDGHGGGYHPPRGSPPPPHPPGGG